jgi:hypothetical protein
MLTAEAAEFFQLNSPRGLLLVLVRNVIPVLTVRALQHNIVSCHIRPVGGGSEFNLQVATRTQAKA